MTFSKRALPSCAAEIRPAPHMDNLVNIYKNMEVASGVTLFLSQSGPLTKLADAKVQANGDLDAMRDTGEETPKTVRCQRTGRVNSVASKVDPKRSGRNRGKSSFATNKRVQVPHSPTTESPAKQEKDGLVQNKVINNHINKCSTFPSEHQLSTEKERSHMSPFFWLREVESSSPQTDEDQTLTCTPMKAPSFSDLKDSDDDVPAEKYVEEEPLSKCNRDIYDSEMFEWTQRECSPELCSSPIKKQVEETDSNTMHGKKVEAASRDAASGSKMIIENLANVNRQEKNSIMDKELPNNAYPRTKVEDSQNGCKPSYKRGKKVSKDWQKNKMEVREALNGSKPPGEFMQCQVGTENVLESAKASGTSKTRRIKSFDTILKEINGNAPAKFPDASRNKRGTMKDKKLGNLKRKYDSIEHIHDGDSVKRKKQKKILAQSDIIRGKSIVSNNKPTKISQLTCEPEQEVSVNGNLIRNADDGGENVQLKVAEQAEGCALGKSNNDNSGNSLKKGKVYCQKDIPALRKCDRVSIQCAFCHSAEETEASGEMAHYSEGRPVLANHSEGSVIRSHKNCTEWAPNVYFYDNIAVNLEEELTRSRRIKCSLCGVKGAALGCYEKSCRKSFHVPCAKKLQECRWDADHFVILCPLHASSKLPCELPITQVRKCNQKGKPPCQRPHAAVRHVTSINRWDSDRPAEKVVLCCSALATVDKEAVSELAKSSGAEVLGHWNPNVTHVIASTNENGACKRTLKVMMGILEGKWILSIKWVQACLEAKRLIEEAPYEITCDIHGVRDGPRLGRIRLLNKQPKLFAGFNFYFTVDFEPSYKGYLQDLVTAAGGTVLHRKPIAETYQIGASPSPASSTIIVYSIELPANCDLRKKNIILESRRSDAEALGNSSVAKLASNSWVLNCIAGHKLQDL
uniref:Uncharacterized protein n=1 Tax=Chenopodium quinoa TaxID=63459 RepID=A0A803MIN0_CHEQI